MRLPFSTIFLSLAPVAFADVSFLTPAAGAAITYAGTGITVTWQDSGVAPAFSLLSTYAMQLFVGGNDVTTATSVGSVTGSVSALTATIPFSQAATAELANGFYIQIISTGINGGTVINYSSRFSISGLTGPTNAAAVAAVTALDGVTTGPATVNTVNTGAAAAPAAGAGGAAQFSVPYNLQTGLTRYAPMQPVPPTSITVQSYTPLFPTSAYTLATTWVAHPTILTTITQGQTFSVVSIENTAAPASMPTGDMQRFLARWKD